MEFKNKKERDAAFGKFAEQMAAEYYIKEGYSILERNWRLNKTEIDLIVQKGNVIVFVEVKARNLDDEDPVNEVSRDKRKRMIHASDVYIGALRGEYDYRFDIVGLAGNFNSYELEVLEDAFISTDVM